MNAKIRTLAILSLTFLSILSITNCYAEIKVGDPLGGGTVFCVSKTADLKQCTTEGSGDYGLIMSNVDLANYDSPNHGVTWSTEYLTTGAISEDDGAANTATIIAKHPKDSSINNAAHLCCNYKDSIEGHKDWYLPSKNELNKMYLFGKKYNLIGAGCKGKGFNGVVECLVGGGDESWNKNNIYKVYWSSSEYSGVGTDHGIHLRYSAWHQSFSGGGQDGRNKINGYLGVRAVRAFNNLTIQQFNNLGVAPNHGLLQNQNQMMMQTNQTQNQQQIQIPIYQNEPQIQKGVSGKPALENVQAKIVNVGESYGGGTVFCVSETKDTTKCVTEGSGRYGLVIANEDQANYDSNEHGVSWSSKDFETGAKSEDDGAANTNVIVAMIPEDNPGNNAAWVCTKYKDPIEGHIDWYLPSKNELNKIYIYAKANNLIGRNCKGDKMNGVVRCLIGGCDDDKVYWSSSESHDCSYCASSQHFTDSRQFINCGKLLNRFGARAIRAFDTAQAQKVDQAKFLCQAQANQIIQGNGAYKKENSN